jgi:hypothetical protein
MSDDFELFSSVLQALEDVGILSSLVIIGGWAQHLYRRYFNNPNELSILRTFDIDLLFARPPRLLAHGNLDEAFGAIGFRRQNGANGSTKYSHPEAEIEFLIPDRGRGDEEPYLIKELAIRAQSLRLVDRLMVEPIEVKYGKFRVKVPDPIRFCFHKLLVSKRRPRKGKREKDIQTAIELAALLSRSPKWRKFLPARLDELPPKQRALVLSLLKESNSPAAVVIEAKDRPDMGAFVVKMRSPVGPWPRPGEPDGPLSGPGGWPSGR